MSVSLCFFSDNEYEAVWSPSEAVHHNERRRGSGLWRNSQASLSTGPLCHLSVYHIFFSYLCLMFGFGEMFGVTLLVWCLDFSVVVLCLCLSSCVVSVVLPYGRLRHAVLPQGRTTDGMSGGVCIVLSCDKPQPSSYPPNHDPHVYFFHLLLNALIIVQLWFAVCRCVSMFIALCDTFIL